MTLLLRVEPDCGTPLSIGSSARAHALAASTIGKTAAARRGIIERALRFVELRGCEQRRRFSGADDGHDLELDQILPSCQPLVQQRAVVALHDLIAAVAGLADPAADVMQSRRCEPPAFAESRIHRLWPPAAKHLDDHVLHMRPSLHGVERGEYLQQTRARERKLTLTDTLRPLKQRALLA